ncbi:MAG: fadM 2 [Acidobacteria bacterium]|nr:fadM 2 [Acidobacteriota bacterium]
MLDSASKTVFHLIAGSRTLKTLASRYGMRRPTSFARRFIAGETAAEAIAAARSVEARGMTVTMDLLGESVTTLDGADAATRDYLAVIDAIIDAGIGRNISLKLTQLGLDVDKASAIDNLRKILERADPAGFFVRIDMENSPYTDVTLEIFETLWRHGYRQMGVVLQSALYRTEADLRTINALGGRVRLVKGAYKEPKTVAYPKKADVDAAYARMVKTLLTEGHYPAIATHDPAMITLARAVAQEHHIAPDLFEFQMLYGVRRDLQAMLVAAGYRVRVYVPFGKEWFPYFMRRLGERPANVAFVIRGIVGEGG